MQNNRQLLTVNLLSNFLKALDKSLDGLNWQEKEQFILALITYTELIETDQDKAAEHYTTQFARIFKSKLQPALRSNLFSHYIPELAFVETGVIDTETFNNLPPGEQGLTEEEFPRMLAHYLRYLKTALGMHYVFAEDETTDTEQPQVETEQTHDLKGLVKGRPNRSPGDNLTRLTMEQTALLIDYLKRSRLVFNGEYLPDKTAGTAFHLLTGYSVHTLRQSLSAKGIDAIKTKSNLKELHNLITHLTILIKNDIKD
jgi:hypothetical protein